LLSFWDTLHLRLLDLYFDLGLFMGDYLRGFLLDRWELFVDWRWGFTIC